MNKRDINEYWLVELTSPLTRTFPKNKIAWVKWVSKRPKIFTLSTLDGKKYRIDKRIFK